MIPELLQFIVNSYEQNFNEKPVQIKCDWKTYTRLRKAVVTAKFHGGKIFDDGFYFNNILVQPFRADKGDKFRIEINSDPNPLKAL